MDVNVWGGAAVSAFQAIGGTFVLIAGAVVTWRKARAETEESESDRIEDHMKSQDTRIDRLERRERIRDDYIQQLRLHIAEGKGPPPPPWPEALIRKEDA